MPADLIAGVDFNNQENTIRELINQEAPIRTVLRLLCLYSIVSNGIKPKVLEEFKRDVLQVRSRVDLTSLHRPDCLQRRKTDVRFPVHPLTPLPAISLPPHPRYSRQTRIHSLS
jgi:hypothetical protein